MKCTNPDYVRCCGVSVESVVGERSLSSTMSTLSAATHQDASVTPQKTTTESPLSNLEFTTISNESDTYAQNTEPIELQTTYDNEIETTFAYDVTESGQTIEPNEVTESDQVTDSYGIDKLDEDTISNEITELNEQYTTIPTFVDDKIDQHSHRNNASIVYPTAKFEYVSEPKYNAESTVNVVYPELKSLDKSVEINEIASIEEIFESPTTKKSFQDLITTDDDPIIQTTTTKPQIDDDDLVMSTEPNLIATTTAEAVSTFPDLISTIEATAPTKKQNNKRRNSIYRSNQIASAANVTPTKSVEFDHSTTEQTTRENAPNKFFRKRISNNRKSTNSPKIFNSSLMMTLDEQHKETISDVHSLLSTIVKQPVDRKPLINRSKSLQQLMAYEKTLFKPSFRHRNSTNISEAIAPAKEMETISQTEKPKRKYNRRLPAKEFSTTSSSTTTTTAASITTNERDKESTKTRYRFNRRQQQLQHGQIKMEHETTTKTTTEINLVTKPNETSQNKPFDAQAALERRKKLFATRQRGRWTSAEKPNNTLTENAEQTSS